MAIEYSEARKCYVWIDDFGRVIDSDRDRDALAKRHGVIEISNSELEQLVFEVVNGCLGY